MSHLYDLCCLADGWHWLLIAGSGNIFRVSRRAFETREEAYFDMLRHSWG